MKFLTSFIVVLMVACSGIAQDFGEKSGLNFVVVEPKSYEQKLLDAVIEKYSNKDSQKQVIIFCWGRLPVENYLLVDPPERSRSAESGGTYNSKLERSEKSNNFVPEKTKLLDEIEKYKRAIRKSTLELDELKREREYIIRKLARLKKRLHQKEKSSLEKQEGSNGYETESKN